MPKSVLIYLNLPYMTLFSITFQVLCTCYVLRSKWNYDRKIVRLYVYSVLSFIEEITDYFLHDKIYDVISTDLEGCFCTLFVSLSLNIALPLTNWMMLNDCLQVFKETLDHHNYVMSVETKNPQPQEFFIL